MWSTLTTDHLMVWSPHLGVPAQPRPELHRPPATNPDQAQIVSQPSLFRTTRTPRDCSIRSWPYSRPTGHAREPPQPKFSARPEPLPARPKLGLFFLSQRDCLT